MWSGQTTTAVGLHGTATTKEKMQEERLTIGVLSPLLAGAYFGVILKGLARHMATLGGRVVAVQTRDAQFAGGYPSLPSPFSTPLAWDEVAGFVTIIDAVGGPYLEQLRAQGKPVVMISHHVPGFECPEVLPDNESGIAQAVAHLVRHGHARIVFAGKMDQGPGDEVHERYEAYVGALNQHGLRPDPRLLFAAPSSLEDGGEVVGRMIVGAGVPCTAVLAATDLMAAGLVRTLQTAGVGVPSMVAVVGFDDRDFAAGLSPSLASIRYDFEQLGETAARMVVDLVHGAPVEPGEHWVKTAFIPRESCGCMGASLPGQPKDGSQSGLQRLRTGLESLLAGLHPTAHEQAEVSDLARRIADLYDKAVVSLSPDVDGLSATAEAAYKAFPRTATISAVLECAQQYRRDLLSEHGYSDERLSALDRCTFEISRALRSTDSRKQLDVSASLQASLREEHYVSLALVGLDDVNAAPKSLRWLDGTHAKSAGLGLWAGAQGDEEWNSGPLQVAGVFGPGLDKRLAPGTELRASAFPPVAALTAEGCQPDDVVMVLPVRTAARYWGILALVGQPEAAASAGGDIYFQWTALLGMTLDNDALLEDVRANGERYALAARAANDGLWDWDVSQDSVFYSPRWKAMLGYDDDDIGTSPAEWFSRVDADDREMLEEMVAACLRGDKASLRVEHRVRAKDGSYRWTMCHAIAVRSSGRRASRMVGSLTDISERKELESRLRRAALYDSLTGLPNRALFMDQLSQAFARAKRSPAYHFCMLFMDLNGFKAVNDTWGHAYGDALLVEVAERLKAQLRENDLAVRLGGDEFAVLVDGVDGRERAMVIAQRLQAKLSVPYSVEGNEISISVTIGAAFSTAGYETPEAMIRVADDAMYAAKRAATEPVAAVALLSAGGAALATRLDGSPIGSLTDAGRA